jgi:SAM-dependent methyltransferase
MRITLDNVVPWGRSFEEYRRMFALTDGDLKSAILGCADGPASFNAEGTAKGCLVTSCDPIYTLGQDVIRQRIVDTSPQIIEYARQNVQAFVWSDQIPDPEALGRQRMLTMDRFLEDFDAGLCDARYVAGELPRLPFENDRFEIAVCSHFLYLYSTQLTEQFHLDSIKELIRVAKEVRMFPLTQLGSTPSPYVEAVAAVFREKQYRVAVETVDYEFPRRLPRWTGSSLSWQDAGCAKGC